MKLKKLLENVKVKNADPKALDVSVDDISFDNRSLKDNSVFVAYEGSNFDSHAYVNDIKKSGKVAVFVSEKPVEGALNVVVDSGRKALALMSKALFRIDESKLVKVAVTGTNGKTTVNYLLESIFNECGYKTIRIGTTEYKVVDEIIKANTTTPSPYDYYKMLALGLKKGANAVCIEASSHAMVQHRLYGTKFDLSIFTNLSGDHLDYHNSVDKYYNSKSILFSSDYSKRCLINVDNEYGRKLIKEAAIDSFAYGFGTEADYRVKNIVNSLDGLQFDIKANKLAKVRSDFVGQHNVYNILAAVSAADLLGFKLHKILDGVEKLKNVPGRLEKFMINDRYFFVDYAHTDDALENVLKSLHGLKRSKIITVFGCGGDRDKTKRPRMAKAAEKFSDLVVVTNDNPRKEDPNAIINDIVEGFVDNKAFTVVQDRRLAIKHAYKISQKNDIVLVAGKGHENYQILRNKTIHFDDREEVLNIQEAYKNESM